MKLVHFTASSDTRIRFGTISDGRVLDATGLLSPPNPDRIDFGILDRYDLDQPLLSRIEQELGGLPTFDFEKIKLLAPVLRPGKVICIGLNYADHAEESGMTPPDSPLVFSKFSSNVVGPRAAVPIPEGDPEVDFEAELTVVIGRHAWQVTEEEAMHHVLGYTIANDLSARRFQFADGQWTRGKSCEGFCPLGPYIATKDEIRDPHDLGIRLRLNGKTMQESWTSRLIFKIPTLIAHLSSFVRLEPGDVILTGTPSGVGFSRTPPIRLAPGDHMTVEIDGLGQLENSLT